MKKYIILLLVAVAVFILFGLGSALVCNVNDAANRASDGCNLKQIALATINTADSNNGVMPQATIPNSSLAPNQRLSWLVAILPNMDNRPLYLQINLAESWQSETNLPVAQRHFSNFLCPSAQPQGLAPGCSSLPSHLKTSFVTSYVGVAGVGPNAAFLPEGHPRCGGFGHDRRTLYPDSFTDGVSQTILIIETAHENGPWAAGHWPTLREIDLEEASPVGLDAPFGHRRTSTLFWRRSSHCEGTHAALGDGSVRWIANTVDAKTLAAAATIAGGEILGEDW
jgi:hypothetical protein